MWLRTNGKWLRFAIVSMISLPYLCTRKGKIIGYMVALHVHRTGIRFESGLLCSTEHSKVMFSAALNYVSR